MKKFFWSLVGVLVMAPALMIAGPGIGTPAPEFTLPDTAGVNQLLLQYRGKVVQLFFWEST